MCVHTCVCVTETRPGWLSVIDTGLDLENYCHSSLCRSNKNIIPHKRERGGWVFEQRMDRQTGRWRGRERQKEGVGGRER